MGLHGDARSSARHRPESSPGCLVLITPALRSTSGVMVVSPSSGQRSPDSRSMYSWRKILVKPRLGMRRCSGIWPPSKPRIMREPLRERWPLWPRVEVLPIPGPHAARLRACCLSDAFFGARMFDKIHEYALQLSAHQSHSADTCRTDDLTTYARTISTRCGTFATMPRMRCGCPGRSIT